MKQQNSGSPASVYGLIGYPLGHSFSARYFADKFSRLGIDAEYRNFEIPSIKQLPEVIASTLALRGLNVTIPYKRQVIPFLDDLDEGAREIGAVNVVCVIHDGGHTRLVGRNADVIGFTDSLRPLLRSCHTSALYLGTGGASDAVACGLRRLGIEAQAVSRTRREGVVSYADLTPEIVATHKLIVNCTPLGMYPKVEGFPDIPYEALTPDHLLFDLVYNPEETAFLRKGREHGAQTKNGLEMLHLQAEASWRFWNENPC